MTTAQILPALIIPLVLWRVYSRIRRNIGRQPLRPRRLKVAVIVFSVITILIVVGARSYPSALAGLAGGLALAVPLGLLGLRLTRFDFSGEEKFYTPNATIGLAVTLVFVGRIAYRLVTAFAVNRLDGPPVSVFQNPVTLFAFGLTAGYYITYYLGVYFRSRATDSVVVN